MLKKLKKLLALWRMRSLEVQLQDTIDTLSYVRDQATRERMLLCLITLRKDVAKARADYIAHLPPGVRLTFNYA